MAVRKICCVPDPVLRKKAKRVSTIDASVKKLVADMRETLHAVPGRAGLAAPQGGVSLRGIGIGIPEVEDFVRINPEVVKRGGEREVQEGCLSIPGYYAFIKRSEWVRVKGKDADGREVKIKGDDLLGQALEHEIDHLNGVLYLDYLGSPDELHKVEPDAEESL